VEQHSGEEMLQYLTREELQAIVDICDRAEARAAAGERPPEWYEGIGVGLLSTNLNTPRE
jgi:hypothetical protein